MLLGWMGLVGIDGHWRVSPVIDICWHLPILLIVALVGGVPAQLMADPYRRHHGKQ